MQAVPRLDFTTSKGTAIVQGSDFLQVFPFATVGGFADNWTGLAARGQLRRSPTDSAVIAELFVTILDPQARLVQFWLSNAVTAAIAVTQGTWDAELYSTSDAWVKRFAAGRWNMERENTR